MVLFWSWIRSRKQSSLQCEILGNFHKVVLDRVNIPNHFSFCSLLALRVIDHIEFIANLITRFNVQLLGRTVDSKFFTVQNSEWEPWIIIDRLRGFQLIADSVEYHKLRTVEYFFILKSFSLSLGIFDKFHCYESVAVAKSWERKSWYRQQRRNQCGFFDEVSCLCCIRAGLKIHSDSDVVTGVVDRGYKAMYVCKVTTELALQSQEKSFWAGLWEVANRIVKSRYLVGCNVDTFYLYLWIISVCID